MRILLILTAACCLTACSGMLLGGNRQVDAQMPEGGSATSVQDNAISADIRRRIEADDELSRFSIGITTAGGRVRLSGAVGSYPARDRAVGIARSINGVRDVDNRLIVNTNL